MQWFLPLVLTLLQAPAYPPPYPRPGVTKLIDNDRILVWDVSWPKSENAPLHRHPFDMTGIYYSSGDRVITSTNGSKRTISTKAGQIQWLLSGTTHAEDGANNGSLRAVMIELKGDGPSVHIAQSNDAPAFTSPKTLLDNGRVTVSPYTPESSAAARHYHRMDTVVVFTENRAARAIFIPAGQPHDDERAASETNVIVFELK